MARAQQKVRGTLAVGALNVGKFTVKANSTGLILPAATAKPSTRSLAKVAFLTNSTGVSGIAINTTGTTWKYANVTSVLPT